MSEMSRYLILTDEELCMHEWTKHLSESEKIELTLLVYELSLALYNLYSADDE